MIRLIYKLLSGLVLIILIHSIQRKPLNILKKQLLEGHIKLNGNLWWLVATDAAVIMQLR